MSTQLKITDILNSKQYISDRLCSICEDGTYSNDINLDKCETLTNPRNTQHIVYDKEYYCNTDTCDDQIYYTGDRKLINILYDNDDNPRDILLDTLTLTKHTQDDYILITIM